MDRSTGLVYGLVTGIILGLIIVVVLFKYANKDHKVKTEYDERQRVIRGKGYMIGFYTYVALLLAKLLWSMTGLGYPLPEFVMLFLIIITGITVMCSYGIWKGVYWGINNDPKKYAIVMAIAIVINIFAAIRAMAYGDLMSADPVESLPWLNIIVIAMFVVQGIVYGVRRLADKAASGEED